MMQVYSNDKLVGALRIDPRQIDGLNEYTIRLAPDITHWEDEVDWNQPVTVRELRLQIRKRHFRVMAREILEMRGGEAELAFLLEKRGVPKDAHKHIDVNLDATIYSWRAFDVDGGLHEELFDLEMFEPV
ncbi:MAG: hypothetical protein DI537_13880 [Stutzerimonas stutzeri]|nr:MAG: hypothetical protein DI537_13880 [Stutzerimonas stutzeri]